MSIIFKGGIQVGDQFDIKSTTDTLSEGDVLTLDSDTFTAVFKAALLTESLFDQDSGLILFDKTGNVIQVNSTQSKLPIGNRPI